MEYKPATRSLFRVQGMESVLHFGMQMRWQCAYVHVGSGALGHINVHVYIHV